MYKQWIGAAEASLINPVKIDIPYSEYGYFIDNNPVAASFIFEALNGEQLRVADLSAAIVMTIPHRANVTILGEYDQYYL